MIKTFMQQNHGVGFGGEGGKNIAILDCKLSFKRPLLYHICLPAHKRDLNMQIIYGKKKRNSLVLFIFVLLPYVRGIG